MRRVNTASRDANFSNGRETREIYNERTLQIHSNPFKSIHRLSPRCSGSLGSTPTNILIFDAANEGKDTGESETIQFQDEFSRLIRSLRQRYFLCAIRCDRFTYFPIYSWSIVLSIRRFVKRKCYLLFLDANEIFLLSNQLLTLMYRATRCRVNHGNRMASFFDPRVIYL